MWFYDIIIICLIKGPLGPVSNIVVNNFTDILLSWQPPFTLNLSNIEPNIVYCIDVFTISCGTIHAFSKCDITQLYFQYNGSDPRNKYQFIITPRSNVAGAINGTASELVTGRSTASKLLSLWLHLGSMYSCRFALSDESIICCCVQM